MDFNQIKKIGIFGDIGRIFSYMKKSGVRMKYLVFSIVFSFGLTIFNMYSVSLLFPLTDGIIKQDYSNVKRMALVGQVANHFSNFFNSPTRLFVLLIFWVYLTIVIKNALQYAAFLSTQYQARISTIKLRELLLEKCLGFGKKFYDKNALAYVHGVLTKSTAAVETQFNLLQRFIIQSLLLVVYLGAMLFMSWRLTLVSVIIFPIVSFSTKGIIKKIEKASLEYQKLSTNLSNKVLNLLYCMPLVKGFAKEGREMEMFSKENQGEVDSSFKIQRLTNLVAPIEDMGTTTGVLLVAVAMAWILSFDKSLSASRALVFFYLAMKIIPGLNTINGFKLGIASSAGSIKEIEEILDGNEIFKVKSGNREFKGLEKDILIKNLDFSYNNDENFALKDVSLQIEKGKVTAIVGPTGSGKSTLANLLLRFYDCPDECIFFDGIDIKDYNIKSLREKMSFVGQEALLFNESIIYNVNYGKPEYMAQEKVKDVLEGSCVADFAEKLPKKMETVVGDRGAKLSGGEKQRIAIARALIRSSQILIMDEPTSALDSKTESKIASLLEKEGKDKTVLMIAHRLSTIKKADKIIYLENGRVAEKGTLEELIGLQGKFFSQWQTQKL